MSVRAALAALAAASMLSGCIAGATPPIVAGRLTILPAGSQLPAPDRSVAGQPAPAPPAVAAPPGMRYLYGSGEAAANVRFGAGWFVFPNPVYGTALKGGIDDVFPPDMRWSPLQ